MTRCRIWVSWPAVEMRQRKVLLVDDKSYGLRQIEAAIPVALRAEVVVLHVPSMEIYRARAEPGVFVALLDFFLDHDRTYGHLVAHEVEAEHLVGFSSWEDGSQAIVDAVRERPDFTGVPQLHAIRKRKDSDDNRELAELFERIFR
jgi:hypothetical protein